MKTALIVPAYRPTKDMIPMLERFVASPEFVPVVVNDGSGPEYAAIFERVPEGCVLLDHGVNKGKGAALKTAIGYVLNSLPECDLAVTADADGQHRYEDIRMVVDSARKHPGTLVLGSRAFDGKVPFKSKFGNGITREVFAIASGVKIRDTQTGLRAFDRACMEKFLEIPGERYEYEMAMLADAKNHPSRPLQIPIETVYIDSNATSHFNPLLDTIRIYRSLFQFCISSVLSFLIDNGIFAAVMWVFAAKDTPRRDDVLIALLAARFVSSHFNYFYNRFVVFRRERSAHRRRHRSYYGYFALVLAVGAASYALTEGCAALLDVRGVAVTAVKILADVVLFVASYLVQKKLIFRTR